MIFRCGDYNVASMRRLIYQLEQWLSSTLSTGDAEDGLRPPQRLWSKQVGLALPAVFCMLAWLPSLRPVIAVPPWIFSGYWLLAAIAQGLLNRWAMRNHNGWRFAIIGAFLLGVFHQAAINGAIWVSGDPFSPLSLLGVLAMFFQASLMRVNHPAVQVSWLVWGFAASAAFVIGTDKPVTWSIFPAFAATMGAISAGMLARNLERNRLKQKLYAKLTLRVAQLERDRLGRELHDGFGSELVGMKFSLRRAISLLERDRNVEKALWILRQLHDQSNNHLSDLRSLIGVLRSDGAFAHELSDELRELGERMFTPAGVEFRYHYFGGQPGENIPVETVLTLRMVFREFAANTLKHSGCSEVTCRFHCLPEKIELLCEDNGVGMDMNAGGRRSGLDNIGHRVMELGGNALFDSQPGGGFKCQLIIPLKTIEKPGTIKTGA
ncbi:MAG: hypothetical protein GMKNLPBB_00620 [Myxococcota bacterium]|nr:hypothetical protein [Myxococcota bacterium]